MPSPRILPHLQLGWGSHTVLLLHGYGQTSRTLAPLLLPLLSSYRFIVPDLPGMGRSQDFPSPPDGKDLFTHIQELLQALIESLQIESYQIVGFSVGAHIALHWLQRKPPSGLQSYVHIDHSPFSGGAWAGGFPPELLGAFRETAAQISNNREGASGSNGIFEQSLALQTSYANCLKQLAYCGLSFTGAKTLSSLMFQTPYFRNQSISAVHWSWAREFVRAYAEDRYDLRESLADVKCPVAVIYGEKSLLCPPSAVDFMRATMPQSRVFPIAGVGHDLMLKAPVKFVRFLHDALLNPIS